MTMDEDNNGSQQEHYTNNDDVVIEQPPWSQPYNDSIIPSPWDVSSHGGRRYIAFRRESGFKPARKINPPVITSFGLFTSGTEVGGQFVGVTGSGFTGLQKVYFGASSTNTASNLTIIDDAHISFITPPITGALSSVTSSNFTNVSFVGPGGTTTSTNAYKYISEFYRIFGKDVAFEGRAYNPANTLNGLNVSALRDYAFNADAGQLSAPAQPGYSGSAYRGGPEITFDGISGSLQGSMISSLASGSSPYVFLMMKPESLSSQYGFGIDNAGSTNHYLFGVGASNFQSRKLGEFGGDTSTNGPARDTNGMHFFEGGFTPSGTNALVVDGIGYNTGVASGSINAALDKVNIGYWPFAGKLNMSFVHGAVIRRIPTAAELLQVRAFLTGANFPGYTNNTITPTPTITALSVTTGSEAGGTVVGVTGSGFISGAVTVTMLANQTGSNITYVDASHITFTTPAITSALSSTPADNTTTVTVSTIGGSASLSNAFLYQSEMKRLAGSLYFSEYRFNNPRNLLSASVAVSGVYDYNTANSNTTLWQATQSKLPLYELTGWNGGPSGLGDGVTQGLNYVNVAGAVPTGIISGSNPYVIMVAQRFPSGSAGQMFGYISTPGNTTITTNYGGGLFRQTRKDSSGGPSTIGNLGLDTNRHIIENGYTPTGTGSFIVDSNEVTSPRTGSNQETLNQMGIFGDQGSNTNANVRIVYMLVLNNMPSSGTLNSIRAAIKSNMWYGGYISNSLGV